MSFVRSGNRKRTPPRRRSTRGSIRDSLDSNYSNLVDRFIDKNGTFNMSMSSSRHSVLSDNTDIEEPRRKSWWKNLGEHSRDVIEILESQESNHIHDIVEEYADVEVLSQERDHASLNFSDSSDSHVSSINISHRRLFTQKENVPQNKFTTLFDKQDGMTTLQKTFTDFDNTLGVSVQPRKLFKRTRKQRTKSIFPTELLYASKSGEHSRHIMTKDDGESDGTLRPVEDSDDNISSTIQNRDSLDLSDNSQVHSINIPQRRLFTQNNNVAQNRNLFDKQSVASPQNAPAEPDMNLEINVPSTKLFNKDRKRTRSLFPSDLLNISNLNISKDAAAVEAANKPRTDFLVSESEAKISEIHPESESTRNNMGIETKPKSESTRNNMNIETQPESKSTRNILNIETNPELESTRNSMGVETNPETESIRYSIHIETHPESGSSRNSMGAEISPESKSTRNNMSAEISSESISTRNSMGVETNPESESTRNSIHIETHPESGSTRNNMGAEISPESKSTRNSIGDETNLESESTRNSIHIETHPESGSTRNIMDAEISPKLKLTRNNMMAEISPESISTRNSMDVETNPELESMGIEIHPEPKSTRNSMGVETNAESGSTRNTTNIETQLESKSTRNSMHIETHPEFESTKNVIGIEIQPESESTRNSIDVEMRPESESTRKSIGTNMLHETKSTRNNIGTELLYASKSGEHSRDVMTKDDGESDGTLKPLEDSNDNISSPVLNRDSLELSDNSQVHSINIPHRRLFTQNNNVPQNRNLFDKQSVASLQNAPAEQDMNLEINVPPTNLFNKDRKRTRPIFPTDLLNISNLNKTKDATAEVANKPRTLFGNRGPARKNMFTDFIASESEAEISEIHPESESTRNSLGVETNPESESNINTMGPEIHSESESTRNSMDIETHRESESTRNSLGLETNPESESNRNTMGPEIHSESESTRNSIGIEILPESESTRNSLNIEMRPESESTRKSMGTNMQHETKLIRNNIGTENQPESESTRNSMGLGESSVDSSGARSEWDSHRTLRKTMRKTFGKDFTPRKSLRTLIMEKAARKQTAIPNQFNNETEIASPAANSTEIHPYTHVVHSPPHKAPKRVQTTLEQYLLKLEQNNLQIKQRVQEKVKGYMNAPAKNTNKEEIYVRKPTIPRTDYKKPAKQRPRKNFDLLGPLPEEFLEDINYKPPKRYKPPNASWVTKKLYTFLEKKLEPKYFYKARVRAEKIVEALFDFNKMIKKLDVAPKEDIEKLKVELAKMNVVQTHFEFYNFIREFMPTEFRVKVIPDISNQLPLPPGGVFVDITSRHRLG